MATVFILAGWQQFVDSLFKLCVQLLLAGAHALGISYNEINIWIFCILEPIAFFIMLAIIIWQWRKIRTLKTKEAEAAMFI
jgi:hypothetical protein